ncbi:LysR family transcriptional regulator [Rheinheimera salexigens]|uniref:Transcriptional regulator n=1 Tax=Rheinheimera salexigens TaxID=1628148 RepID=A0A1E7QAQ3_9GAMM|nr:LysR family transcriptional regulator [Rheinheimera salexigens]OEY71123.1 transcriptional regulator [Rheinheimera salexigens]
MPNSQNSSSVKLSRLPKITLEQWATFKAVVDEGSFAKAAEHLHKSQSSVSYIIAKLEAQLPAPALMPEGRKAVLTEAGKVLYRYASNLLAQASQIENIANYIAQGWETEVTLAVDAIVAMDNVFCALQSFSADHPQPRINVLETTLSGTDEAVLFRKADIVLSPTLITGFMGMPIGESLMQYVASPNHPLVQLARAIHEDDLKQHRQIVIKDSGLQRQRDEGWLGSEQRWSFSHISSSIKAVTAGLGFAKLPPACIAAELKSGQLVPLKMATDMHQRIPLYLIKTAQSHAGPAVEELAQRLQHHLQT